MALIAGGVVTATDARGQTWTGELVYEGASTSIPLSGVIRNWGPDDLVYVFYERFEDGASETNAELSRWSCSNNDGCATETHVATASVGDPLSTTTHLMHPSMAIRKDSGVVYLTMVSAQKLEPDCDSDSDTSELLEGKALDLQSVPWDSSGGFGSVLPVEVNDGVVDNVCVDHGMSSSRYDGTVANTCATQSTAANQEGDQILCDSDASATTSWVNEEILQTLNGSAFEDHPSLDLYLSSNDRAVAAHYRASSGGNHEIRVLFPDSAAVLTIAGPTATWLNHPSVATGNGHMAVVWEEGQGSGAKIKIRSCDFSALVDCTDIADWDPTASDVVTAQDASFPQIVLDDSQQFVMYQYDSDATNDEMFRAMLTTRCGTGSWTTPEVIRTPDDTDDDQTVEVGRPGIVLNRDERIVHTAFVEFDVYEGGSDYSTVTDGDLFWYHRAYSACN